jgi:SAM-dependent methyltransferase
LYRVAFEDWAALLPPGGHVLDIGCGHGTPVVATLLARGFEVTGIDLSEGMLTRARAKYPAAHFSNRTAAELTEEDGYDGVCAFFSLLHTDPIELRVAFDRIRRALKPGGYLLIGSLISDLSARLAPMYRFKGQWVWGNEFSLEELQTALAECNRFTIVRVTEEIQDLKNDSDQATSVPVSMEPADTPPTEGEQLIAAAQAALARTPWLNGKSARQFFTVLAQRPAT